MEAKHIGTVIIVISILAIILSLLAQKNEKIIINLAVPAFAAGLFIAFTDG